MSAPSDRISVFHLNDGFIQPMLNFRLWRASCPSASTSLPPKPALRSIPASRRFETERPSGACADRPSLKFRPSHGIADYDAAIDCATMTIAQAMEDQVWLSEGTAYFLIDDAEGNSS